MKKVLLSAVSMTFAIASAHAECPIDGSVTTFVLKLARNASADIDVRNDYDIVTKRVLLSEKQKEYLREKKGYSVVKTGGNFHLSAYESKDEYNNRISPLMTYFLRFAPADRDIWIQQEERQGAPASVHVDNQKVLADIAEIDARMAKSNDPAELNGLQARKISAKKTYRPELDGAVPAMTSLDLALSHLPECPKSDLK